jgi:predicted HicB family RNase H-like nuclease
VEEYLAFCADRGEEPDQPFSGKLSIKLSPEQHRRIILAAENSGKDLNSWVAEVLAQAVN